MTTLAPNEYRCFNCLGVFTKGWSDEEADAEYDEVFGDDPHYHDDRAVVCDDCYNKFMAWFKS